MARLLTCLLAALAVLALGACTVDLSVELGVSAAGAGQVQATVTLDKDAAGQVTDLAGQLRVEDLEQAGWEVDGPRPAIGATGGATLRVSKRFASPAGAARAIEELSGADGPFSTLRLTRTRTLWKTKTVLVGKVDLSAGLGAFGDKTLDEKLGAPGLGLDPVALERELGKPLARAVVVRLVGRLPGRTSSNAPAVRAGAPVWPVALGAATAVSASSEAWNVVSLAWLGLALVSALVLLVVLVRRSRLLSRT